MAYAVGGALIASFLSWFTVTHARERERIVGTEALFQGGNQVTAKNTETTPRQLRMEEAWSLNGTWGGVAWDPETGILHASRSSGRAEMDATGTILRDGAPFPLAPVLRLARFSKTEPAFLAFGTWSENVTAYDPGGNILWRYPTAASTGIDDVWAADLSGDGLDEVVVGFNGGTGVHVLDGNGRLLWKSTDIGNVWRVSAGDVDGQGRSQVVTTAAGGRVHVFGADGTARRELDAGLHAYAVRVGRVAGSDAAATIFAAGSIISASGHTAGVTALSGDGAQRWFLRLDLNAQSSVYSAYLAADAPWLAVGLRNGQVYVIDAQRGNIVASIDGQGSAPEMVWIRDNEEASPMLVISSRTRLSGYRMMPS